MSRQVVKATLASVGYRNLTKRWKTSERFMREFKNIQWTNIEEWRDQSKRDFGEVLSISGGISERELKERTQDAVLGVVNEFYNGGIKFQKKLRGQFLPSLKDLRNRLGEGEYDGLQQGLSQFFQNLTG